MRASWVAAYAVGVLVTSLTATPASAGFVEGSFFEGWTRADLYPFPSASEAPLFEPSSFELEEPGPLVNLEGPATAAHTYPLSVNWNPVVRHATEPSSLLLMGTGLLGIATLLRRRQRASR